MAVSDSNIPERPDDDEPQEPTPGTAEGPASVHHDHSGNRLNGDAPPSVAPTSGAPTSGAPTSGAPTSGASEGDASPPETAQMSDPGVEAPDGDETSDAESDGEPQSAFDALPDPAPEESDDYNDWPYTDRRPPVGEPPPDRPLDAADDEEHDEEPRGGDMGFFDHLQELRSRIIKAIVGLVVGAIIAAIYSDFIIVSILLRPAREAGVKLQNFNPMGQLTLTLQVLLVSGLIISIPWIIWQFWQFVKPGLYPKERRYSSWIALATIFCFLVGVAFAYFVMVPTSLDFAAEFVYEGIENKWAISEYFSFILGFILACGVVFEMPMLSFALARFGILTPAFMRHYRRHAAIVILIASAIITPTPDPFNQLILAVPLYVLFEISILVSAAAARKRDEAYIEEFGDDDIENIADKQ